MTVNIGDLLRRRAHIAPSTEALVEPAMGRRLTFRELNARANRVANGLRGMGVGKGDRVALLLMNGAEFVESFYAVAKIGAVNVPLNWRLVPDELEFILADSGATVLLFGSEFAAAADELRSRGDATAIEHWIQVGSDVAAAGALDYADWLASQATVEPELAGADDDLLFIMYTSGTTGPPKGVMHTHDTVMWAIQTVGATADFRVGDRFLNSLPMFHVGALTPSLCVAYRGLTLVSMRAFDPDEAWRLIDDEQITTTLLVPAMLQVMLGMYDAERHRASALRWVMSGAAPVPLELIKTYESMGIEIHQVYGLTESCGPACLITGEDALARAGSTGRSFLHTDVRVAREDGSDCDRGEPGEVLVRGPHVMTGYWNRPDATAETIVDGWLHTGDVATMDADGFVTIIDRTKDMLISGGENVYPAEIENVLLGHPAIVDAAVIGVPSARWGESPLAIVVCSDGSLCAEDVMAHTRGKLAPFKTVKKVEFVTEIPRNPSGKILKRELRARFPEPAD
jgi:acyl-CoA synthetase (AMP-forming)/AMP-acid ligase II